MDLKKVFLYSNLVLAMAIAAGRVSAASDGSTPVKNDKPPETPVSWHSAVTPGPAVTLRVKHPFNKSMIYEGTLDREQKSANSYHEVDGFFLNSLCAGREEGRDMVAMQRKFTSRKRTEKSESGKTVDKPLENSAELIDMGPNFSAVGTLRCYAYDNQNRIAYKTMHVVTLKDGSYIHGTIIRDDAEVMTIATDDDNVKIPQNRIARKESVPMPHVCINEAPHYMFPILPERAVAPGDTWKFRVPTIIPLEQGLGAKVLPTQFDIVFNGRLRDVRETANGKTATVDYQIAGVFDSSAPEFSTRFPDDFLAQTRITHRVSGEGSMVLDLEHGWILERHENFFFNFYGRTVLAPEQKVDNKGRPIEKARKPAENKADITSRFDLKLLLPGTRLPSGAVVPSYDE